MTDKSENKEGKNWKSLLSLDQYHVLRMKGTEGPFTGKFWDHKEKGMYRCAGCGAPLFASETKFDSGCGWPSYTDPVAQNNIITKTDSSHGMNRTEVLCRNCGGHLGHVFTEGPPPTGLRYCINSLSLTFEPVVKMENEMTKQEKMK
jgi:peptide-methionine (R)-S-oxide reductase